MAKKILIGVGAVLGIVVLAAVGLIGWLTVTEYKPDAVEHVEVEVPDGPHAPFPAPGDSVTILSQNTGYAGLGKDSDFLMDGGGDVAPTKEQQESNQSGLAAQLEQYGADVYFLQEVDTNSGRTHGVDQSLLYW